MARSWEEDDPEESDAEDLELPDDADDDESAETQACPRCGREVYEDAERCAYCGHYISEEEPTGMAGKPMWFKLGLVVLVLALVMFVVAAVARIVSR